MPTAQPAPAAASAPSPSKSDPEESGHAPARLPGVRIDSYSLELRDDDDALVGDRASQTAFREVLERWRQRTRHEGDDPLGETPSAELDKQALDRAARQDPEAARLVLGAAEAFADDLAGVIEQFMHQPAWRGVERIVVGGGFRQSEVGAHAIERAGVVLRSRGVQVELRRLRHAADDGGLIGCAHLAPRALLASGHDALLAIDLGGTNVRCGIVRAHLDDADDLSQAAVVANDKWQHADDQPDRAGLLDGMAEMLNRLIARAAREGIALAPFVGVACPGMISRDGSIAAGAQNLPGDWERRDFHLPGRLARALEPVGGRLPVVRLHNDAVLQGLSELPFTRDVRRWAVLTIGTGLGNASYTNL